MAEKKMSLSEVIKKNLSRKIETDTYLDLSKAQDIKCVPTGSLIIDKVLGLEGIPRGRITELFGAEASGKTTVAMSVCLQAQKEGGVCAYLDFEQAFNVEYAQKMGIDLSPDKFALLQPNTFEEGWEIVRELVNTAKVDVLVIDSVSGMTPAKVLAAEVDAEAQIGILARLMSRFMAEMSKKVNQSQTALILINQLRSRIKASPYDTGPDVETTGGKAIKYYASIRMEFQKKKTETIKVKNPVDGTETDQPLSNIVAAINRKNKLAIPYKKADFVLRLGEGIDNVRSVIDIAVNIGLLQKGSGGWHWGRKDFPLKADSEYMNHEGKIQGIEQVRKYMLKNSDVFGTLVDRIYVEQDSTVAAEAKLEEEKEDDIAAIADAVVEQESKPKAKGKAAKKEVKKKVDEATAEPSDELGFEEEGTHLE